MGEVEVTPIAPRLIVTNRRTPAILKRERLIDETLEEDTIQADSLLLNAISSYTIGVNNISQSQFNPLVCSMTQRLPRKLMTNKSMLLHIFGTR